MGTVVQFKAAHSDSSVATIPVTLDANITAGNAVAVFVHEQSATRATRGSVADSAGAYTRPGSAIANDLVNAWGLDTFYKLNHAGGTAVVTFTPTTSSTCGIVVVEISGIATGAGGFDVEQRNYQALPTTATDAVTTGAQTNTAQPGLLVACALNSGASATPAAGTGLTNVTTCWSIFGTTSARVERKAVSTIGSQSATWTTSSNTGHICAFMLFIDASADTLMGQALL